MNRALVAKYGKPQWADARDIAERLGIAWHPDLIAFSYPSRSAAKAFAQANQAKFGHPSLGMTDLPDGRIGRLMDLGPAMARMRKEATDARDRPEPAPAARAQGNP